MDQRQTLSAALAKIEANVGKSHILSIPIHEFRSRAVRLPLVVRAEAVRNLTKLPYSSFMIIILGMFRSRRAPCALPKVRSSDEEAVHTAGRTYE